MGALLIPFLVSHYLLYACQLPNDIVQWFSNCGTWTTGCTFKVLRTTDMVHTVASKFSITPLTTPGYFPLQYFSVMLFMHISYYKFWSQGDDTK